eukprot:SAG31_NODE_1312_length_8861_cov_10.803127_3_plen_110_part_00
MFGNVGIFATTNNRTECDHIVAIVGFGGKGTGAYWIVQNSFGSVWGEGGFFRIKRSSALVGQEHNLGIEQAVSWAMPAFGHAVNDEEGDGIYVATNGSVAAAATHAGAR